MVQTGYVHSSVCVPFFSLHRQLSWIVRLEYYCMIPCAPDNFIIKSVHNYLRPLDWCQLIFNWLVGEYSNKLINKVYLFYPLDQRRKVSHTCVIFHRLCSTKLYKQWNQWLWWLIIPAAQGIKAHAVMHASPIRGFFLQNIQKTRNGNATRDNTRQIDFIKNQSINQQKLTENCVL
jgi:hypothetical protein